MALVAENSGEAESFSGSSTCYSYIIAYLKADRLFSGLKGLRSPTSMIQ